MGRGHSHSANGAERRVTWALLLTGGFMVVEAIGGWWAGSLALLADAGHMLTDTAALALSWYAVRAAQRPATPQRSFGHSRIEILAAFINGVALIAIAAWIVVEAVQRLAAPEPIRSGTMLVVAVFGLLVNIAAFFILSGSRNATLNLRGAFLHVAGDMLGSLAAIVAALVILVSGWTPIDPILSVFVVLLIVRSAWRLVREAWHVLMEGAPRDLDVEALKQDLVRQIPGVMDVHHVHAWLLTPERPLITLHARIAASADHDDVLRLIQERLKRDFGISHATVQVERDMATGTGRARAG